MYGYGTIGRFRCPVCAAMRLFLKPDPQENDPCWAECEECSYSFGYRGNDVTGKIEPVITTEMVVRATAKLRAEWEASQLSAGARLEVVTGRAVFAPRDRFDVKNKGRR